MSEVLIVGSGASGVNAAVPLVKAGHKIKLLDFGNEDLVYDPLIPSLPFHELRRSDEQQHRYFLGDHFEGIPFGPSQNGAQLTPPRHYITADVPDLMPVVSESFTATESLALGGLASGWGAGVFPFGDQELEKLPIKRADLERHYDTVAERIGIAGDRDDLLPFFGDCPVMMPPAEIDTNAEVVLSRYIQHRPKYNERGFFLGRTRLALCTEPYRGRGPNPYHDMDFWSDTNRSVYRPRWTLDELKQFPNFSYVSRRLVLFFREQPDNEVQVIARHQDSGVIESFNARALILASGTLSSARIILRSFGRYRVRVPLVCNPHLYAPLINFGMLGREPKDRRYSLAQLTAIYCPSAPGPVKVQAQFFSYRSLLGFRLLKDLPIGYREGLKALRLLMPLLGVLVIQHEDHPTARKFCMLHRGQGDEPDRLNIHYALSDQEERSCRAQERRLLRFFRMLGCCPIKLVRPGHGASIHYAGTFPMGRGGDELSCDADGRLVGTRAVFLVDGSVFPYLPAKGLTFTMMANADRVGTRLAGRLK